jgi:hypothetical protein
MIHRILLVALSASLLAGCVTATSEPSRAPRPAAAPPAPGSSDEEAVECDEDSPTGSHIVSEACRTQSQRKEMRRQSEDLLRRRQLPASTTGSGSR